jgi:RecA-family ATPase
VGALRDGIDAAPPLRAVDGKAKGGKRAPTLVTVSAAELAAREFPPISYVIPEYVAEGLTVLAGRPKTGKSWMCLGWAIAVASGGVAFGKHDVEPGDVLYLALEDNDRRLKKRLNQMLPDVGKPARLHLATQCPRLGAGAVEVITEWCRRVEHPRLIVVDVFGKLRPDQRDREKNLYDADYKSIEPLKMLADQLQLAVIAVHHTNKRDEPYDPFDAVSGTTGLTGAADTVLVLLRSSQGTTLYGRGRDIEEVETALSFDKVTGMWTSLGAAAEVHRSDERSKLIAALHASSVPMTPTELTHITGLKNGNVRRLLGKMVHSGEVEKAGRGAYRCRAAGEASVE